MFDLPYTHDESAERGTGIMMHWIRCLGPALAVGGMVGLLAAAPAAASPTRTARAAAAAGAPDYAQPSHWLARPSSPKKKVDVFYVYPTSYSKSGPSAPNISTIDDPGMIAKAKRSFAQQATAFETVANVYAPYYRQADAAYVLTSPLATQTKIVGGTPTTDVTAAFDYYLKHFNHGRPFILAGHSQGSNVLLFVMARYLVGHPAAYHRMIAAYIVGYGVTHKFLAKNPQLKFARGADDTGVIVSWNTEAPGLTIENPVVQPGAIAINPITWTRSERRASAADSLGSLMTDAAGKLKKVSHYADARVDKRRGVVVCSTCDVSVLSPGTPGGWPRGIYHIYDYPFYYFNLRHNAANRIQRFMSNREREDGC